MTAIYALAVILHQVIFVYTWIIIISALITFVQPDPYNPIVQTLYRLTTPVYRQLRKRVPTIFGGIDLAPFIILIALQFIDLAFILPLANNY